MSAVKKRIIKFFKYPETHPTEEQMFQAIKSSLPQTNFEQFKIEIQQLEKEGKLKSLFDKKKQKHYHIRKDQHFHFICVDCGKVKDLEIEEGAVKMINNHCQTHVHSFGHIKRINMSFEGQCHECQPANKS